MYVRSYVLLYIIIMLWYFMHCQKRWCKVIYFCMLTFIILECRVINILNKEKKINGVDNPILVKKKIDHHDL
jgi:hypothetical protein